MTDTTAIIESCTIQDAVGAIHAKFTEAKRHDKKAHSARI